MYEYLSRRAICNLKARGAELLKTAFTIFLQSDMAMQEAMVEDDMEMYSVYRSLSTQRVLDNIIANRKVAPQDDWVYEVLHDNSVRERLGHGYLMYNHMDIVEAMVIGTQLFKPKVKIVRDTYLKNIPLRHIIISDLRWEYDSVATSVLMYVEYLIIEDMFIIAPAKSRCMTRLPISITRPWLCFPALESLLAPVSDVLNKHSIFSGNNLMATPHSNRLIDFTEMKCKWLKIRKGLDYMDAPGVYVQWEEYSWAYHYPLSSFDGTVLVGAVPRDMFELGGFLEGETWTIDYTQEIMDRYYESSAESEEQFDGSDGSDDIRFYDSYDFVQEEIEMEEHRLALEYLEYLEPETHRRIEHRQLPSVRWSDVGEENLDFE
jgi:hypothetical protein